MIDAHIYSEDRLVRMLHEARLRPSVNRLAVLEYVANRKTHPTADEIFCNLAESRPSLSRTTVYNCLHALVDAGLLRELDVESGYTRFDLAPQPPHSHFVCKKCGHVYDMGIPDRLERFVTAGFCVDSVNLYFSGLCPDCAVENQNTNIH